VVKKAASRASQPVGPVGEARGIKGVLTGTSGIGKTTQLLTLDPQRTLFLNLEAGELAVQGWPGDEVRIRDWEVARDLAAWIGGANPAMRDDQSYGPGHFARVCAAFGPASQLDKYDTVFVDSISVASRICLQWCSLGELSGLEFVARIGIERDKDKPDDTGRNVIKAALGADHAEYARLMGSVALEPARGAGARVRQEEAVGPARPPVPHRLGKGQARRFGQVPERGVASDHHRHPDVVEHRKHTPAPERRAFRSWRQVARTAGAGKAEAHGQDRNFRGIPERGFFEAEPAAQSRPRDHRMAFPQDAFADPAPAQNGLDICRRRFGHLGESVPAYKNCKQGEGEAIGKRVFHVRQSRVDVLSGCDGLGAWIAFRSQPPGFGWTVTIPVMCG